MTDVLTAILIAAVWSQTVLLHNATLATYLRLRSFYFYDTFRRETQNCEVRDSEKVEWSKQDNDGGEEEVEKTKASRKKRGKRNNESDDKEEET